MPGYLGRGEEQEGRRKREGGKDEREAILIPVKCSIQNCVINCALTSLSMTLPVEAHELNN